MRRSLGLIVGLMTFLASPLLSQSWAATCSPDTVSGVYVYSLAGVGPDGFPRSEMGVITVHPANTNGLGSFSGTVFMSVRGDAPFSGSTSGSYQLYANCFAAFSAPAGLFMGYVSDAGDFIQFASPFDSFTQLTGVARRAH